MQLQKKHQTQPKVKNSIELTRKKLSIGLIELSPGQLICDQYDILLGD